MRHPLKNNLLSRTRQKLPKKSDTMVAVVAPVAIAFTFWLSAIGSVAAFAQDTHFVLDRDGRTIVLEPYAPNILRITFSKDKASATAAAGYGLVGTPSMAGWSHERDAGGNDVFRSPGWSSKSLPITYRSRVYRIQCRSTS